MRKCALASIFVLSAVILILPFGALLSACFGYRLMLLTPSAFAVITASVAVITVVLNTFNKASEENKISVVLLSLAAPMSVINAVLYMYLCMRVFGGIWGVIAVLIGIACCFYLMVKYAKPSVLKKIGLALSVLAILPVCILTGFSLLFGNMSRDTVVKSIDSPNKSFYAEVIDSDQGALGGETYVDVYEKKGINTPLFRISKKPQRAYQRDWGEFENMEIYWKNDNCLVINSAEYIME